MAELRSLNYLGGRNSSLGESEGRRSVLGVSWSRKIMSLPSPGTTWVLEGETSSSLPLTELLVPFFLAEVLGRHKASGLSDGQRGSSSLFPPFVSPFLYFQQVWVVESQASTHLVLP